MVLAPHIVRAARRRPMHNSTALQYIYDADVSGHRRHPDARRALGKSVVLGGREQYLQARGGGDEHMVLAPHIVRAARRRPMHNSTALQYIYDADVSRHRRHPDARRALGKSVVLGGRE